MYRCLTVNYTNEEEGKVNLTQRFKEEHWIIKLDILRDAIYELEEMYEELLTLGYYGHEQQNALISIPVLKNNQNV